MFTLKYKTDGTLNIHKARLVAKGFTQTMVFIIQKLFPPLLNGIQLESCYLLHSDHTLFTKISKAGKIAVFLVYVDYIILSEDDHAEIIQLKLRIDDEFEIKDVGNLKYLLGMEITRSKEGMSVSQR